MLLYWWRVAGKISPQPKVKDYARSLARLVVVVVNQESQRRDRLPRCARNRVDKLILWEAEVSGRESVYRDCSSIRRWRRWSVLLNQHCGGHRGVEEEVSLGPGLILLRSLLTWCCVHM
jgi:hypothetical protein